MEKLNFACPWGYGDIKQSWSGTNYGLKLRIPETLMR